MFLGHRNILNQNYNFDSDLFLLIRKFAFSEAKFSESKKNYDNSLLKKKSKKVASDEAARRLAGHRIVADIMHNSIIVISILHEISRLRPEKLDLGGLK